MLLLCMTRLALLSSYIILQQSPYMLAAWQRLYSCIASTAPSQCNSLHHAMRRLHYANNFLQTINFWFFCALRYVIKWTQKLLVCRQDWDGWGCTNDVSSHLPTQYQHQQGSRPPPSTPEAAWLMPEQLSSLRCPHGALDTAVSHLTAAPWKPFQVVITNAAYCITLYAIACHGARVARLAPLVWVPQPFPFLPM